MTKRLFDATVALMLLILTAPLQLAIAVAIRVRMGSPVLFRQQRTGRDGRAFALIKFRTMRDQSEPHRFHPTDDAERVTPLGAWLRRWSLDELPTFWNVVRGDMSMVGPRPLPVEYESKYSAAQRRRHDVRPGITGLAVVQGRNAVSWSDRFAADLDYVAHHGMRRDVAILAKTVRLVVTGVGIASDAEFTGTEFTGTEFTGTESG